jgi:hypothetical protein
MTLWFLSLLGRLIGRISDDDPDLTDGEEERV